MKPVNFAQNSTIVLAVGWVLSSVVIVLAILAWAQGISWQFGSLNSYQLFPLFGLIAFGLMWSHYIVSAVRQLLAVDAGITKRYYELTSWLVLVALLLHPGLLIWQLFSDGLGLPPGSYMHNYVAPGLRWAALLGTVCLGVFIVYELGRHLRLSKIQPYLQYASDAAMVGIFAHSLRLGSSLQRGWIRGVWLIYAVTFGVSLVYTYWHRFQARSAK